VFRSPNRFSKGLITMKKFLTLAVVIASLTAFVGCDDKKTTGGGAGTKASTIVAGGSGSGAATTSH
jgi:hypothetical protein